MTRWWSETLGFGHMARLCVVMEQFVFHSQELLVLPLFREKSFFQTDHTRAVLTVIAVRLVYLCLAVALWPAASAQSQTRNVAIVGRKDGDGDVVIKLPSAPSCTSLLPVRVQSR